MDDIGIELADDLLKLAEAGINEFPDERNKIDQLAIDIAQFLIKRGVKQHIAVIVLAGVTACAIHELEGVAESNTQVN